jgi:glucose-1-phosphate thymidylyltransferase
MIGPAGADRAVVLARGLGTRMRRAAPGTALDAEQAAVAETGLKAMIPVGRPFIDHVLGELAEAGCRRICLVIGPEHDVVREYYGRKIALERLTVEFAVQAEPLGTADAVLAAEEWTGGEPFLVLNSDNLYPAGALAALRQASAPAVLGFEREALIRGGNIPAERIARFALLDVDARGHLRRILEKPGADEAAAFGPTAMVSMNAWHFERPIFDACRAIHPSARGELELTDAVQWSIDRAGVEFTVVRSSAPVLDLSGRDDIPAVAARLAGREVRL